MLYSILAVLAITAATSAEHYYQWNGLSTDFTQEKFWQSGPVPLLGNEIPAKTTVGAQDTTTYTQLPRGETFTVGSKLTLLGNTKLFLGDGRSGQKTTISFQKSNEIRPKTSEFNFAVSFDAPRATWFDWSCNLNWLKVENDVKFVPEEPPCKSDNVFIRTDRATHIDILGNKAGAYHIYVGKNFDTKVKYIDSCAGLDSVPTNYPVYINFHSRSVCKNQFSFLATDSKGTCTPSTCAGTDVTLPNGNIVKTLDGERTGNFYNVDEDGKITAIKNVKTSVDASNNTVYTVKGQDFAQNGVVITSSPTPGPTAAPNSQEVLGSTASAGSSTLYVIIGAVVAAIVLIVIIVVVVVMVKSKSSSGLDERNIVSFENPMYDDVEKVNPGYDEGNDGGIYDDPEMAQDGTSGYMDVPANQKNKDSSGYMDVPAGNEDFGTGYMDVAPGDDEDEDDDDNEDI